MLQTFEHSLKPHSVPLVRKTHSWNQVQPQSKTSRASITDKVGQRGSSFWRDDNLEFDALTRCAAAHHVMNSFEEFLELRLDSKTNVLRLVIAQADLHNSHALGE